VPPFCLLLRKHLRGARLQAVEQIRFDRVLRLAFSRGEESWALVHEVMGRHSNLMLLAPDDRIVGALKVVPPSRSRARPILSGGHYEPAPTTRRDPREPFSEELRELLDGPAPMEPGRFIAAFNGFSPFAAEEVLARAASRDPEPDAGWKPVPLALQQLMARVTAGEFEPAIFFSPDGAPADCWAFASARLDTGQPAASMSAALDTVFRYREESQSRARLRLEIQGSLRQALQSQLRQREEAERHLAGLDDAELLRISGELLAAARDVPRGASAVELPNYYDPEQRPLRVELDPELGARENAAQYFRRHRRAVAAAERSLQRLPAVEERISYLEALVAEAGAAELPGLEVLRARLRREGIFRKAQAPPAKRERDRDALPPGVRLRHYDRDGWEVLWGENAASNDYLTTRVAQPGDLWLHARAVTGAHVVIRGPARGQLPPRPVLEAAARTAAAHSDARHSSLVPVDYTFRRYVRKPRGSAPGAVLYVNEKTLHVRPGREE
jgi:predicted ribosome quality control (RQC) complex YloA/Tae2 family protein